MDFPHHRRILVEVDAAYEVPPRVAPEPFYKGFSLDPDDFPGWMLSQVFDADLLDKVDADPALSPLPVPLHQVGLLVVPMSWAGDLPSLLEELVRRGLLRWAYPEPVLPGPPAAPEDQGYLFPPTNGSWSNIYQRKWGIGAVGLQGGAVAAGLGGNLMVVERSWHRSGQPSSMRPDDLPEPPILWGEPDPDLGLRNHGTGVLGILAMRRLQTAFGWGICPQAGIRLVAAKDPSDPLVALDLFSALLACAVYGLPHEVLLVEDQVQAESTVDGATIAAWLWVDPVLRYLLSSCIAKDMTVVLPAGNGGRDLATLKAKTFKLSALNSFPGPVTSVLPIVVGAVAPSTQERWDMSNFGPQVTQCAWGSDVYTLRVDGDPDNNYKPTTFARYDFGGTSAAAAIVAGAAVVTQAIAVANGGQGLHPAQIREGMRAMGVPTANGTADQVGTMPLLPKLREGILGGQI